MVVVRKTRNRTGGLDGCHVPIFQTGLVHPRGLKAWTIPHSWVIHHIWYFCRSCRPILFRDTRPWRRGRVWQRRRPQLTLRKSQCQGGGAEEDEKNSNIKSQNPTKMLKTQTLKTQMLKHWNTSLQTQICSCVGQMFAPFHQLGICW